MNTVSMTDEEVAQFLMFQKHRGLFTIMQSAGVFDIGYGKATFNVANNIVQNITIEEIKYKR